jgi:hypothetical protein
MNDKFDQNKVTSKTVSQSHSSTVINKDGEVLSQQHDKTFKIEKGSEPAYMKFYLQDTERFDLLKKGTVRTMFELFKRVSYNDNRINLNSTIRKEIAEKLNIKEQTFNNSLNELKRHNLLIHLNKSVYMANTLYFGKGEWSKIKKHRNNIGIEVKKITIKGKTTEVMNFNFDKCCNEKTSIVRTTASYPAPKSKPLTKREKTKLQKFLSIFKRRK